MNKSKGLILLLIISLLPVFLYSQPWKRQRWEGIVIVGAANCLTEVGGKDGVGTNDVRDLELTTTRPALGIAMQYRLGERFFTRVNFIYGRIRGADNLTQEEFRRFRNLSFKSPIVELSTQVFFALNKEQGGHRYKLKGVRGRKQFQMNTYFFLGIGVFYFNPKTKFGNDVFPEKWYALRPLQTEGIKYSPVSACIPMGMGFRRNLSRRINVGFEIGLRKTFTDYLDDVSTNYKDPADFDDPLAAELSRRSDEITDSEFDPASTTGPGQQRGQPNNKDAYMFFIFNIGYIMRSGRSFWPKF